MPEKIAKIPSDASIRLPSERNGCLLPMSFSFAQAAMAGAKAASNANPDKKKRIDEEQIK
jgi:hypothetical protein